MTQSKAIKASDFLPPVVTEFFNDRDFFGNHWFNRILEKDFPAVNIRENKDEFNIELAAPGFAKEDFKISLEGRTMTIQAEKETDKKVEDEHFTRKEFSYNSFSRSFTIPEEVDETRINAKYSDGILRLVVPKKEEAKSNGKKDISVA